MNLRGYPKITKWQKKRFKKKEHCKKTQEHLTSLKKVHWRKTLKQRKNTKKHDFDWHFPKWRICAWLEGMSSSKTVPVNMLSSHAQILTDRGTKVKLNRVVFPSYFSHAAALWFRHTVGRVIGNLINPFMRVRAEMTRYLATSRESPLLPPLTPRMWEISSLGQSKEWCALCGGVWVGHGRLWPNRLWPAVCCDRLWPKLVF